MFELTVVGAVYYLIATKYIRYLTLLSIGLPPIQTISVLVGRISKFVKIDNPALIKKNFMNEHITYIRFVVFISF